MPPVVGIITNDKEKKVFYIAEKTMDIYGLIWSWKRRKN